MQCDEQRPGCGQCLHGKRSCTYTTPPQTDMPTNDGRAQLIRTPNQHVSALLGKLASTSYHRGVDPLELLNHFVQTTEPLWMGSAQCQRLLQQNAPRVALGSSFLLHAMLAFSAYHIAAIRPGQQPHEHAGALHYSLALQSYRKALDKKSADAEALFACCMLLTLLSFKHLSDDLYDDDTSKRQQSLTLDTVGIRFIGGPRILIDALARRSMLDQGIWEPLTRNCKEYLVKNDDMLVGFPGASQSMAGLEALCRSDEVSSPFHTALMSLRLLMQCYVSCKHKMVEFTFCFAIQLDPRFLRFIEESVPKALLVLCYWYALVAQVDQWWAHRTAQVEGLKLLCYLQDNADLAVQALLVFPADLLNAQSSTMQIPIIL